MVRGVCMCVCVSLESEEGSEGYACLGIEWIITLSYIIRLDCIAPFVPLSNQPTSIFQPSHLAHLTHLTPKRCSSCSTYANMRPIEAYKRDAVKNCGSTSISPHCLLPFPFVLCLHLSFCLFPYPNHVLEHIDPIVNTFFFSVSFSHSILFWLVSH